MMIKRRFFVLALPLWILGCQSTAEKSPNSSLIEIAQSYESITGKSEYLNSPYVTAGDKLYMVGHQDGSFPDLGWHIDGEMGGIWDHPIKLMDGFSMLIMDREKFWVLDSATSFQNYAFGNLHSFENEDLDVQRFQFVPEGVEGLVLEIDLTNKTSEAKNIELVFTGHVDLRPTWLADRQGLFDGEDEGGYNEKENAFIARDRDNPWFVAFGGEGFAPTPQGVSIDRKGKGRDFSLVNTIELAANESTTVSIYLSGSFVDEQQAITTLQSLKSNSPELLRNKIAKYDGLDNGNQLTTTDPGLDQMFQWIKYNTQWLVRDVSGIGRGVSAGIPDYPWWFGTDGAYIIQGLVSAGMHEEALSTIDLIMKLSREENGNGQIVHEVSSNGVVFNPGNLNTTPTFINALWKAYQWTGDQRIIDQYYPDILDGIEWIDSMDKDQNGNPDGAGMMEIHGLHSEMIDVVAYLAKAYQSVAHFARLKGDQANATKYEEKATGLIKKINSEWWVEDASSYADFRATKKEALELIDAAIVRSDTINKPWSVTGLEATKRAAEQVPEALQGFVVHHNWVVNTPMEVALADSEKAEKALMKAKDYQNRFGMFVTGIDRDENQEKAEKWKAFSYVGAVMTLPTGVQAIAEANYSNSDGSLEYLKMLENSFSYALPGSMYEVSPDFGMIAQGWNIYAVAVPIVDHFFGIQPSAYAQKIIISPQMPSDWDEARLENIKVGENEISISFTREGDQEVYKVSQKLDWNIQFEGNERQTAIIE